MKKRLTSLTIALNILIFCAPHNAFGSSEELDPDIEALLDDSIFELQAPVPINDECLECEDLVQLLTPPSPFNILNILRQDIYRSTTGPVTRRSLLDQPALTPDYLYNNYWSLSFEPFFNYSPRVYFTKDSAFLRDYVDLNNATIIQDVQEILNLVMPDSNINIPGVLGLFSTIKLQQYRAGVMLGFARQWKNWVLAGRIPLYYLLNNFFLTDEEIDRISNNPFFVTDDAGVGTTPEDEARKFGLKHLVSDRFGVGDSRLSLLLHLCDTDCQDLWFGLQSTIPTAKDFSKGLIGGEFDPDVPIPPFNLQHFCNVFFCNQNQDLADTVIERELTAIGVDALDRLSTILINAPLGNGKHFGFGPELNWRYHINEYFSMHTYTSLQAFTPHREDRFYLIRKTEEDFDRDWQNADDAPENLAVLNRLIIETLFPIGVRTTIHPGVRFQINHAFLYKSEHWDLSLGFDYWLQASEEQKILLPEIPFGLELNKEKGARSAAHQGKLFASVGYYGNIDRSRCDTDWYVLLNADGTVLNDGIGQNYSISIRIGIEF